ncbi:MAG: helix-turn-helix domain-containing protein [Bacteroidia bacterium]
MHIGLKIKMARMAAKLKQEDLAERINKSRPLVSHIEQTGKVNYYTLKKICKVLDIDIATLDSVAAEPGNKTSDNYKNEIKRLQDEIDLLRELVQTQKEVIVELRKKPAPRKK